MMNAIKMKGASGASISSEAGSGEDFEVSARRPQLVARPLSIQPKEAQKSLTRLTSAAETQTTQASAKPIFHQDWWLEAAAGPDLERIEVRWDRVVTGSLAFVRRRVHGLRLLNMPPYTHTQGPVLSLPRSKPAQEAHNLRRVVKGLMEQLPAHDRFHLFLDPFDPSAFSFGLAGCSIEQDFTFRFAAGQDLESAWSDLDSKTRNLIRSAGNVLEIVRSDDVELLIAMSERERAGTNRHDFAAIRRLARASFERGQCAVLAACDEGGKEVAASMLVWDDKVLYYWQSCRDPERVIPGANPLLVWESIKFAVARGLTFDFDGYSSETAARFAAKFGIAPIARASVAHMSSLGMLAHTARQAFTRRS